MAVYRSAHGKPVDMGQLSTKFEKVRAVGNMNVNARGDVIDNHNRVVQDNTNRVKNTYNKTLIQKAPPPQQPVRRTKPSENFDELSSAEKQLFDDNDEDIKK